jgi:hypothetical protein
MIQLLNALIPWKTLQYITGQVNYGECVADDWDRRSPLSLQVQACLTERPR